MKLHFSLLKSAGDKGDNGDMASTGALRVPQVSPSHEKKGDKTATSETLSPFVPPQKNERGTVKMATKAVSPVVPLVPPKKTKIGNETEIFTGWRVHFDQSEKLAVFPDGATQAEVEALYPAAVRAEPIERQPTRPATEAEARELGRVCRDMRAGRIAPQDGTRPAYVLDFAAQGIG